MENIKICENKIENYEIALYTNGLKNAYQLFKVTDVTTDDYKASNTVAPVDFYNIATAIMTSKNISEFNEKITGCWSEMTIESLIADLENESALKVMDAENKAESDLAKSFDVYFDDE